MESWSSLVWHLFSDLRLYDPRRQSALPHAPPYPNHGTAQNWGENGFFGPPYALLQGSLADLARQPPFENKAELPVKWVGARGRLYQAVLNCTRRPWSGGMDTCVQHQHMAWLVAISPRVSSSVMTVGSGGAVRGVGYLAVPRMG